VRFWPISRHCLNLIRKTFLFRFLLGMGLLNFIFYFALIYFLTQVQAELESRNLRMPHLVREALFTGTGGSYKDFILVQSGLLLFLLGFAGALLVGNDFRFRSLAFYLSKPIGRVEYFLGKFVAVFTLACLLTLAPTLILFIEYGAFSESFQYWIENLRILRAICLSSLLISASAAVLVIGIAAWARRTLPLLLVWSGIFLFLPLIARIIRGITHREWGGDPEWYWGLIDYTSLLRWLANYCFGVQPEKYGERAPYAFLMLALWMLAALYLFHRNVAAAESA
jgi:ABC-type transport system involved in multi-copper enzyme maturation permease subunit